MSEAKAAMYRTGSIHEQCWDAIPWIANGRASEADQQRVAQHAAECDDCREELARQRELQAHLRGTDDVIAAPHASWQKLLARIDAQPEIDSISESRAAPAPQRWMVAAMWAQGIAIALLLGLLFATDDRAAPYTTLTAASATSPPASIRVVFAPGTAVGDINQLLRGVHGNVVAGPSEAGVYSLALADPSAAAVEHTIAALRRHRGVLFAEPAQARNESTQ
jgi:hypothetical protein